MATGIRVVSDAAAAADQEHVLDALEYAQQTGGGVAGAYLDAKYVTADKNGKLGADHAVFAYIADCVHIGFTFKIEMKLD